MSLLSQLLRVDSEIVDLFFSQFFKIAPAGLRMGGERKKAREEKFTADLFNYDRSR